MGEIVSFPAKEKATILVIGDAHFCPGQDLRRAEGVGRLVLERRPDVIVTIGDWYDMHSLNQYERPGSKSMEGVNVQDDINVGDYAFNELFNQIETYNRGRRAINKKLYRPELVVVHGNHEYRLNRFLEDNPKFEGILDFKANRMADLIVPYRHYVDINGVLFTHVPHNKARPIQSVYGARKVLQMVSKSIVWGHTHSLDFATSVKIGGDQIFGLNVGCLFDHNPKYMDGRIKDYWRGVILLTNVEDGRFDFETISYEGDQ